MDADNLRSVQKSFNKPADYKFALDGLASRGIYAITSFIFGLDNDTLGVADRTLREIESWPPGLPIFGQLTPFPSTPQELAAFQEADTRRWAEIVATAKIEKK